MGSPEREVLRMRNAWKRKLAIWLAGCYIATCFGMLPVSAAADTGAASAGGNLITNGSFENLAVGTTGLTQGTHGMTVWNGTGTVVTEKVHGGTNCLLYTSPSPRD